VRQIQEYREHADECRTMAAKMRKDSLRAQMLDLARQWDDLADKREKFLAMRAKLNEGLSEPTPKATLAPAPA
jgi:hypothetical protein